MKSLLKLSITLFISSLLLLTSSIANAAGNTGKITLVDFNGTPVYAGKRDICFQMLPAIPAPGFACVYNTNFMRTQMSTMLREAYELKKTCSVFWSGVGFDGLPSIDAIQCF